MPAADILNPEYNSPSRKSTVVISGFNLTASIMGGGILSIPFALSKAGMLLGTLLMIVAAIATERTMYLLCLCARLTGAKSYGEVGEAAFGKHMEYFISIVLCVFLCFAIIGYMVLAKDIWTAIAMVTLKLESPPNDDLVLAAIIVLIVPFFVQKTLHALRFNCYVGFLSVSTLCIALVRHAWAIPLWSDIFWWSTDAEDILVAFPIISLSFLGIFNILPIQNALIQPSRHRVLLVMDGAIFAVLVTSMIFGSAGYLFAGAKTEGNILRNCDTGRDWNLLLGQLGCGIMVVLAMPMMLLPCRECLIEILDVLVNGPRTTPVEKEQEEHLPLVAADLDETYDAIDSPDQNRDFEETRIRRNRVIHPKIEITNNTTIHYSSTFFILSICYMVAVRVPGVAVVWSILGCSLGYLIGFILPCLCYLQIERRYPDHSLNSKAWVVFSWILTVSSVIATVVCTVEAIRGLD